MGLEIRRRIRDNLYGSIDVSTLEGEVIAHPIFQRLRRIRQTAFLSLVFPGASHTRLEHSLGVMHLAGLAWSKIKDNQMRISAYCNRYRRFDERERHRKSEEPIQGILSPTFTEIEKIFSSPYVLQALRLAALLHDLGHPPFSHSGERFLPNSKTIAGDNPNLPPYLKEYLERSAKNSRDRVHHEVFTILLVDEILNDIYYRVPNTPLKVSAQDIASIVIPDISPLPNSELLKCSALFLCRELVSGEIDIDRMDYLRRDAKECGVAYGLFDVDRILDSLAIYTNAEDGKNHLALQYSGLPAFEDYLRARQSMYVQLYFHKTSTACEAMMQKMASQLGDWNLPAKLSEYASIDEHEIRSFLTGVAKKRLQKFELPEFEKIMKDLFVNRRLWKMVYEITENEEHKSQNSELQAVIKFLKNEKIPHEVVSSHNVLTKFSTRKNGQKSPNYLRIIKLDERQFMRVEAVEDFSSITKEKGVLFHRIYVSQDDANEAKNAIREMFEARDA